MSSESWIALQAAARPGRNRCSVQFGGCVRLGKQLLRIEKFLGKGGFGAVFQVADEETREKLAVKVLTGRNGPHFMEIKNELDISDSLQRDVSGFFPVIRNVHASENHGFILMELLVVSLQVRFRYAPPTFWQIRNIMGNLLSALMRLRELGICHFDVKNDNIMVAASGRIKIIDFSCASFDCDVRPTMIVRATSFTRAPELVLRYRISHEADMWSLGIAMLSLYLHRTPSFAAVIGKGPEDHEHYMLTCWQASFGPIPQYLIDESVEKVRYYIQSETTGRYGLIPYSGRGEARGCDLMSVLPSILPVRFKRDHDQYKDDRHYFLDLMSKIFVYEGRITPHGALWHPFFTGINLPDEPKGLSD